MFVCLSVCGHSNVRLTTPPVLMLWGTQGYLWLPYDLTEVINLIGERFKPKNIFFQKNTLCHSFRIIVILSILLSFLPDFCHSFRISVIPSKYCHSYQIIVTLKCFPSFPLWGLLSKYVCSSFCLIRTDQTFSQNALKIIKANYFEEIAATILCKRIPMLGRDT